MAARHRHRFVTDQNGFSRFLARRFSPAGAVSSNGIWL
jgi:hypothetical protein